MEFEKKKDEITREYGKSIKKLDNKFGNSGIDFLEEHLQNAASGLVSSKDYKQKQERIELIIADQAEKLLE
jgi:hypothetical protein